MEKPAPSVVAALWKQMTAYVVSQSIHVAARLSLADHVAGGPLTVPELAGQAGADPDALARLLRLLAAEGLFTIDADGKVANTAASELLRTGVVGSQRDAALHFGGLLYGAGAHLLSAVTTGRPAFEAAEGRPFFDFLAEHGEHRREFDGAMAAALPPRIAFVLLYPWRRFLKVVDVGGGRGDVLMPILRRNQALEGIVFDRPEIEKEATAAIDGSDVAARARFVAGDFFAGVPSGGDAYLLSAILHDWDDEAATVILRNCRAAMTPDARLVVVDAVIDEAQPGFAAILDLVMLMVGPGRERTLAQWEALLAAGGFRLGRSFPSPMFAVLEAAPT